MEGHVCQGMMPDTSLEPGIRSLLKYSVPGFIHFDLRVGRSIIPA